MAFWKNLFGGGNTDNVEQRGQELADMLRAQGYTDDTTDYKVVRRIAEENGMDSIDLSWEVQKALTGTSYCSECRGVCLGGH